MTSQTKKVHFKGSLRCRQTKPRGLVRLQRRLFSGRLDLYSIWVWLQRDSVYSIDINWTHSTVPVFSSYHSYCVHDRVHVSLECSMSVASQKLKIRKKEVNSGFNLVKLESCVTRALETGVTSNVQANQVIQPSNGHNKDERSPTLHQWHKMCHTKLTEQLGDRKSDRVYNLGQIVLSEGSNYVNA